MPAFSRPLADCPDAALAAVAGVLTDIDDTLTHEGAIEPEALSALARLRAAGLPVIAITGRPMGWSEPFARDWPIDAIVAENGAVALFMEGGRLRTEYAQDEATRAINAQRLAEAARRVIREVPGATLAQAQQIAEALRQRLAQAELLPGESVTDSTVTVEHYPLENIELMADDEAYYYPFVYEPDELADLTTSITPQYSDPDGALAAWARQFLSSGNRTLHGGFDDGPGGRRVERNGRLERRGVVRVDLVDPARLRRPVDGAGEQRAEERGQEAVDGADGLQLVGPEVARQANQARQATLQTPQPDRDHVRAAERLAQGRNALRQMPEGLPLRRRPRRNRHVLAMTRERVLTLGVPHEMPFN